MSASNGDYMDVSDRCQTQIMWLQSQANADVRAGLSRFGIPTEHALGIKVDVLRRHAKTLGKDPELAEALWGTAIQEARLLAIFISDALQLSAKDMDRWCRDFDNWVICDTACFDLFDKSPLAFGRVDAWANRRGEFQKRAAFALLAGLAQHQRQLADAAFLQRLPLLEAAASDDRHYVKKGLSWALRGIGKRNDALRQATLQCCQRLRQAGSRSALSLAAEVERELKPW